MFFPPPLVKVFADLVYELGPGAGVCPDEERFRLEMLASTGGDAFAPDPERISVGKVHVTVTRSPAGFIAGYAWTGSEDVLQPTARFKGRGTTRRDCLDVLAGVVASLSSAFAVLEIRYGEKLAPRPTVPARQVECAKPPAGAPAPCEDLTEVAVRLQPPPSEPTPPEPKKALSFRLGTAAWTGQVTTDRGVFGITLDAGVRYGWFSAAVEGRWDPPLGLKSIDQGSTLDYTRITGALLPCAHFQWLVGCAKGEWGRILFNGTASPRSPRSYGAVGVRLGLEFPVAPPRFALTVAGEVLQNIDPASVTRPNHSIFQVASTNGGLGLGVLVALEKP